MGLCYQRITLISSGKLAIFGFRYENAPISEFPHGFSSPSESSFYLRHKSFQKVPSRKIFFLEKMNVVWLHTDHAKSLDLSLPFELFSACLNYSKQFFWETIVQLTFIHCCFLSPHYGETGKAVMCAFSNFDDEFWLVL